MSLESNTNQANTNPSPPPSSEPESRSSASRMWWPLRLLLKSTFALVLACLLTLLLITGALFTQPGLNSLLWVGETMLPQLKVTSAQGALFPRFTLYGARYDNPELGVSFSADELELAVDPQCLIRFALCIDTLRTDNLVLKLQAVSDNNAPQEATSQESSLSLLFSPLPIDVESISLNQVELDVFGTHIQWQAIDTAVNLFGSELLLQPSVVDGLSIRLAADASTDDSVSEVSSSSAQAANTIVLPEVYIPLAIEVQGLEVQDFIYHAETPIEIKQGKLVGRARGHDVEVDGLSLVMPQLEGQLNGSISLTGGYPLDVSSQITVLEAPLTSQSLSLVAKGAVSDLELDLGLSNLLAGEFDVSLQPLEPLLPFSLQARDVEAFWPLDSPREYDLALSMLSATGSLDSYQLQTKGAVDGELVPQTQFELTGKGSLSQIALSDIKLELLEGRIEGSAGASWEDLVAWQGELKFNDLQPGLEWSQAQGTLSGELQTSGGLTKLGGWWVDVPLLNIDGVIREYPLKLEGAIKAADEKGDGNLTMETPNLSLAHADNRLSLQGAIDKQYALNIDIQMPSLAQSLPQLEGALSGSVGVDGELDTPRLDIQINGDALTYLDNTQQQAQNQAIVAIQTLTLDAELSPLPAPQGSVALKLGTIDLSGSEQRIDKAELNFSGDQRQHQLDLMVLSELVSSELSVTGELIDSTTFQWQGALASGWFSSQQGEWRLQESAALSYEPQSQQALVGTQCWLQADSKVCLARDARIGEVGDASLAIYQFDFAQLESLMPEATRLEGGFDAGLTVAWAPQSPLEAEATLLVAPGGVTQSLSTDLVLDWNRISLKAALKQDRLSSSWTLDFKDNGALSGQLNLTDVSQPSRVMDANLQLNEITLAPLEPLIGEFNEVDALIEANIGLSGSLMHPQANGQLTVENIKAQGEVTPIEVNDGWLRVDFRGYQAALSSNIITEDGALNLSGDADWQDLENWITNLKLSASELEVAVEPIVIAKVSPDISLNISPGQIKLRGDIDLPSGQITVDTLPESAVSVSSDEVILDRELVPLKPANAIPFNVDANLKVTIGDEFGLSAFGLDGSLVGGLSVTQKNQAPFILGEINIEDGSYRSFGQDLLIDEGKIVFNGPADQPYLSIKAVRNPDNTADDVIAGVTVTGEADEPQVEIFSEPAMPQANALSYLLRGQDLDGDSSGDAMTTALIGLSLARGGRVVGEIGEAFGVQDLQLNTQGTGDDSQVTVSGYILPGLQVKYGIGIFDSIGEFTVRYRLMQDLYIEAVSGADNALDLLYQFQFD